MEFVEGAPLPTGSAAPPLRRGASGGVARRFSMGSSGAQGGLMHRDIKPPNIYIRDDSSPVLLDLARRAQKSSELTALVTPGYAPFEQYHTQGKQGAWRDIYALGGVLYWMVTGKQPARGRRRASAPDTDAGPALQAANKSLFRPEFPRGDRLARFRAQPKTSGPQSVPDVARSLLGASPPGEPVAQPVDRREELGAKQALVGRLERGRLVSARIARRRLVRAVPVTIQYRTPPSA